MGVKQNLFEVDLVCSYSGDTISNLHGDVTALQKFVTCSWNDSMSQASDNFHLLWLDYSYGTTDDDMMFSASTIPGTLTFDCSSRTEL